MICAIIQLFSMFIYIYILLKCIWFLYSCFVKYVLLNVFIFAMPVICLTLFAYVYYVFVVLFICLFLFLFTTGPGPGSHRFCSLLFLTVVLQPFWLVSTYGAYRTERAPTTPTHPPPEAVYSPPSRHPYQLCIVLNEIMICYLLLVFINICCICCIICVYQYYWYYLYLRVLFVVAGTICIYL